MGDDKPTPEQFFKRMTDVIKAQREKLTSDGGVPGTGLSFFDLPGLVSDLRQFKASCLPLLAENKPCTASFNASAKKLGVEVSYEQGVVVQISALGADGASGQGEPMRTRKVVFQPPGQ